MTPPLDQLTQRHSVKARIFPNGTCETISQKARRRLSAPSRQNFTATDAERRVKEMISAIRSLAEESRQDNEQKRATVIAAPAWWLPNSGHLLRMRTDWGSKSD